MNITHLLPLFFITLSCSSLRPDTIKADLTLRVELSTVYDSPNRGAIVLYPISSIPDSIYSRITFPNLCEVKDTAFAKIYFTGKNEAKMENNVLALFGNRAMEAPLIWVDYDNDLDFSENKEALSFSTGQLDISVPNTAAPYLVHTIRFHKPKPKERKEVKEMLEKYILNGHAYVDFYMEERRNIFVGDFIYKEDSLRIGLMDWDINGIFNDVGEDRIVFGRYKGEISGTQESEGAVILDSTTYFQGNKYAFEVLTVSENGKTIVIKPTSSQHVKKQIAVGDMIPDLGFQLVSGYKTNLHNYLDENKYLYLSFWASWCTGCIQEVDDLKDIQANYSDKVTVIGMNYNESVEKMNRFLEKYDITWINGFSTPEINTELLVDGLPRNILIDQSGRIVEMDIHPLGLLKRIGVN